MINKYCPRCKRTLPRLGFYSNKNKKDGLSSYCRVCHDEYTKKYQRAHLEQHRASQRKYYRKLAERFQRGNYNLLLELQHIEAFKEGCMRAKVINI